MNDESIAIAAEWLIAMCLTELRFNTDHNSIIWSHWNKHIIWHFDSAYLDIKRLSVQIFHFGLIISYFLPFDSI